MRVPHDFGTNKNMHPSDPSVLKCPMTKLLQLFSCQEKHCVACELSTGTSEMMFLFQNSINSLDNVGSGFSILEINHSIIFIFAISKLSRCWFFLHISYKLDPYHPTPTSVSESISAAAASSLASSDSDPVSSLVVEASVLEVSADELFSEALFRFRLDDGMAHNFVRVTRPSAGTSV